ncbi:MAG: hypothetical protein M0Z89_11120 [Nitrospiraceae bacterium]|nr:hypothetical protein [Nitrospiraceae bacterium]
MSHGRRIVYYKECFRHEGSSLALSVPLSAIIVFFITAGPDSMGELFFEPLGALLTCLRAEQ